MSSERQEYNENTPWWGEHIHRYNIAMDYINSDSKVLDIACGNGFGSYLISQKTKETVIGADISEETVAHCTTNLSTQKNLRFMVVDGTRMTFEDSAFDCITSFETIEHTTKYKEMIREFYRTLKSDRVVVLSTPNIKINSPGGAVLNPFHTQEFTYNELTAVLGEIFDEVKIYGQKYVRYQVKSLRNSIGKVAENILYLRGVRKLPLSIQNRIMQLIIRKNMYPLAEDFCLVSDKNEILACKTFLAICKKK